MSTKYLTKAEAKIAKTNPGTLIESAEGWELRHGCDIIDETRGGKIVVRMNQAWVKDLKHPSNGWSAFFPMTKSGIKQAKGYFDMRIKK